MAARFETCVVPGGWKVTQQSFAGSITVAVNAVVIRSDRIPSRGAKLDYADTDAAIDHAMFVPIQPVVTLG